MHHQYFRGNYGLYFNIWDRMMGTNHPDYEKRFYAVTTRRKIAGNDVESVASAGPEPR
jgi:lathosterol oxidase